MNNNFFEIFEEQSLIKNNKVSLSKIQTIPLTTIIDVANKSINDNSTKEFRKENSLFSHSASLSLGGGNWPCSGISCRLKKVKELAQFAGLYSDRVYINNFLSDFTTHQYNNYLSNEYEIRQDFFNDLSILVYLRPLIENSLIVPVTPPNYCPHCIAKKSFGVDADKRFDFVFNQLTHDINKNVVATCKIENNEFVVHIEGPNIYLEHGVTNYYFEGIPDYFKTKPKILNNLLKGYEITLSSIGKRVLEVDEELVGEIRSNILFELAISICLGSMFLTERPLDIEILNGFSGKSNIEKRNNIIQNNLTCLVPFIEEIIPSDLLKLRSNEDEFILFRNALNKVIDEYLKQNNNITEKDAKNIYNECLQPLISKLNQKVKLASRKFFKDVSTNILSWGGAITIGLYNGFLKSEISTIASSLGLTAIVAGLVKDIINNYDIEKDIRQDEFYFLWKVKELSVKKKLIDIV